ncbi:caspase family protein [Streptomyces sp. NPDC094032]|uniref:caspase, EACC1-associated type n=1 Tax=Streptomyces sp. NPDC094032 TaxID=3155308 RepID=UPI00332FC6BB
MELADPHGSYAVLIGSSRYHSPDLEDLPGVAGNVRDLGRLLEDPTVWGLPPDHCVRITDPLSREVVLDAVHDAARRATDALLVYYAGHGLPSRDGDGLLLGLPASDPDRPYSWMDFQGVRREVLGAGRRVHRVVILDCCYSGQAMAGTMSGSVTLAEQARIAGTHLLTATSANMLAEAPVGMPHTAFTGELIRLLDRGLPNAGPLITAPELYEHLLGELRAKNLPRPEQRVSGTGRAVAFAHNRHGARGPLAPAGPVTAPRTPARPVPRELRDVLRGRPRLIADRAALLRATDPAAAEELLSLAAVTRPAQEAAALLRLLREQGRPEEAYSVLAAAAAERVPADLASYIRALHALDADDDALLSLDTVGRSGPPEHVAGTIRCLREEGDEVAGADADRILAAAIGRLHTTEAVLDLAGALWSAQLDDEARKVLRAPAVSSPQETARLAEVLRGVGRVEEALALYVQVFSVVAQDPAELVRILRVADEAERSGEADVLLTTATQATTGTEALAALCDALWASGMGERALRTLARAARSLSSAEVTELADLLHSQGHDEAVLHLFGQAALHRAPADTPVLMATLRTMGRPLDAERLLRDAAGRSIEDVASLLGVLADLGAVRDGARLREALPADLGTRARLIRALHAARGPFEDVLDPLVRQSQPEFDRMLRALHERGEIEVAGLFLRHVVAIAPQVALERLRYLDEADAAPLDRTVLRAALHRASTASGADAVAGVDSAVLAGLVHSGTGATVDERITAIAALCEAGLSEDVVEALADATLQESRTEIMRLLGRMQERELTDAAHAVVRSARWMFSELYRDFVLALRDAGLLDLAVYALTCDPGRLTAAQREGLARALGVSLPFPGTGPDDHPAAAPPTTGWLRDRLRRR